MSTPRAPHEVNHVYLFDAECVKTRLDQLTAIFVNEMAMAEMEKRAMEAKRKFKEPEPTDIPLNKLYEIHGETARAKALEVLEVERKNYVDSLNDYIQRNLTQLSQQLRFLVYTVNEKGQPLKLKYVITKKMKLDYDGNWNYMDEQSLGDETFSDVEKLQAFARLQTRINEFVDYVPYFNEELKSLWQKCVNLTQLETVRIEDKKP
jgi:hypothetical protein